MQRLNNKKIDWVKRECLRRSEYWNMSIFERQAYVSYIPNDDLILLMKDLDYLEVGCEVLLAELQSRRIEGFVSTEHILPTDFFNIESRLQGRLPTTFEYLAKLALYLSFKYSIIILGLFLLILSIFYSNLSSTPNYVTYIYITLSFGVLFLPIMLCWFNFIYKPITYTIVRPFNEPKMTLPLRRFITKNIGLLCQGFTLSDRDYEPSLSVEILRKLSWLAAPFLLVLAGTLAGPAMFVAVISTWVRQSVRVATIYAPSGFINLEQILSKQRTLNGKHFMSGGQCFNIKTVDGAWKYSMQLLINRSDFILVDLSFVREGSEWELSYIKSLGLEERCIAICQEGYDEFVQKWKHLFGNISYYDPKGCLSGNMKLLERISIVSKHSCI